MGSTGWTVTSGTVTGPAHQRTGAPNQDAYAHWQQPDAGLVVVAVADGAGSLPRSHEGAALAARTAVDAAAGLLAGGAPPYVAVVTGVDEARHAICDRPDAAELGCTLVLAAIGHGEWATALVGDSFCVATMCDTDSFEWTHQLLAAPPAGEYANVTRLLTSQQASPTVHGGAADDLVALTVASDGLTHAVVQAGQPHAGFFTPLVTRAAAEQLDITALLEHMAAQERLDDDTTVVVAARTAEAAP